MIFRLYDYDTVLLLTTNSPAFIIEMSHEITGDVWTPCSCCPHLRHPLVPVSTSRPRLSKCSHISQLPARHQLSSCYKLFVIISELGGTSRGALGKNLARYSGISYGLSSGTWIHYICQFLFSSALAPGCCAECSSQSPSLPGLLMVAASHITHHRELRGVHITHQCELRGVL